MSAGNLQNVDHELALTIPLAGGISQGIAPGGGIHP